MANLPPLQYEDRADGKGYYAIDELVPGLIVAHSGIQSGAPTVKGTRLPTTSTWVWEELDKADTPYTREQIIAAVAFQAGVGWQRSRKRRGRMWDAVTRSSAEALARRDEEYEPGDETI